MWSDVAAQWDVLAALHEPTASSRVERVATPIPADAPFAAHPDLRFLYHSTEHDRTLNDLVSSIGRGESVVLLTGRSGIGKTTVCRSVVEHLDRRTLVSLVTRAESVDALFKRLLVDFGVISSDETARRLDSTSTEDLARALIDFLLSLRGLRACVLVIVDDTHLLSADVLYTLGRISEMAGERLPLQLMLVGEPALTRMLRTGDLRPLDRRVAFRAELGSLERHETYAYVAHRMAVAARRDQIRFEDAALRDVFSLSRGVPGAVNAICERALTLAVERSMERIDKGLIREAVHEVDLKGYARSSRTVRKTIVALILGMLLAGTVGAGWVFRAPLGRAMAHWRGYWVSLSR